MSDCRRIKRLLPLWVGQDLPDAASTADVASHLEHCADCELQRRGLQVSLEILQGSSSETLSVESRRLSVWPLLASRISAYESDHRRDRFNGWIPAGVMALAVALMIAVSLPSIHREVFGVGPNDWNTANLFDFDPELTFPRLPEGANPPQRPALGRAVNFKPDQW